MVRISVFWAKRSSQRVGMLSIVLGEEDADVRCCERGQNGEPGGHDGRYQGTGIGDPCPSRFATQELIEQMARAGHLR